MATKKNEKSRILGLMPLAQYIRTLGPVKPVLALAKAKEAGYSTATYQQVYSYLRPPKKAERAKRKAKRAPVKRRASRRSVDLTLRERTFANASLALGITEAKMLLGKLERALEPFGIGP